MSKTEIYQTMLSAWLRYHSDATPSQVEGAKKRIAKLLGGVSE